MSTVFPVDICFLDSPDQAIQGFTRDISEGGLCLELNTSLLTLLADEPIQGKLVRTTISTTFRTQPIEAQGRVAWSRPIESGGGRLLVGLEYTQISSKDSRSLLRHAKRMLWIPRIVRLTVAALLILSVFFYLYKEKLIAENRKLSFEVLETAKQRSKIYQDLQGYQNSQQDLLSQIEDSKKQIRELQGRLSSGKTQDQEKIRIYTAEIDALRASQSRLNQELKILKSKQQKLSSEFKEQSRQQSTSLAVTMNDLYSWLRSHRHVRFGMVSSFEGDPDLAGWAFTYDQALVIQVFALYGDFDSAAKILNFYAKVAARDHGVFYNAYDVASGDITESQVHVGPNVWIALAALQYQHISKDARFFDIAKDIAQWLIRFQDREGGLRGGPNVTWYSTEHHLDAYALMGMMYELTKDEQYSVAQQKIMSWIQKYAYSNNIGRMNRGKGDATIATDTFAWAVAAIGPAKLTQTNFDPEAVLEFAQEHCHVKVKYTAMAGAAVDIQGYDFSKASNIGRGGLVSSEWTAQMIVTFQVMARYYKSVGNSAKATEYYKKADFYTNELMKMVISSPSKTGQGHGCLPYATMDSADTGHGWRTPKGKRTGSVAGTAYTLLAWSGFNPFELLIPENAPRGAFAKQ